MKEFRVGFNVNIGDKNRMVYKTHKGGSVEQVATLVQSDLAEARWITDEHGHYFKTSCVTDFLIYELLRSGEESQ